MEILKHKQYPTLFLKVVGRVETKLAGGSSVNNYVCEEMWTPQQIFPTKGEYRPRRNICDKDYIERDWEVVK